MPVFELDDVTVETDGLPVLRAVTASIPESGITVVVGPSGSGKTTFLRLCNRLEVPAAGVVRFRGDAVTGLDPLELRRKAGMVFQRPALFGGTVRDNLAVAAPDARDGDFAAALERAELHESLLDRHADEISGGEAQRVCIARTLVTRPEVLLMDEPTAALDARPRVGLERLARHLADEGVPLVWVTHQLDQMRRLADHVIVLLGGAVRYTGAPSQVEKAADAEVVAFVEEGRDAESDDA